MTIKDGHYYRRRDGKVVGPATRIPDKEKFAWIMGNSYTENYEVAYKVPSPFKGAWDLVEDLGPDYPADAHGTKVSELNDRLAEMGVLAFGKGPTTGTDGGYNFVDDKCCICGSTDLEIVDWKAGHLCADCLHKGMEEPTGGAIKHDSGKPDLTLVTRAFEEATARAMMHGLKKYGRDNYREGGFTELRLLAACKRHLSAYIDGEDMDADSGNCHLDHACGALNMLLDLKARGLIEDDRFKGGQQ